MSIHKHNCHVACAQPEPAVRLEAKQAAAHLNATSSLPVRVHLVSNVKLPAQPWFEQHLLTAMPAAEAAMLELLADEEQAEKKSNKKKLW